MSKLFGFGSPVRRVGDLTGYGETVTGIEGLELYLNLADDNGSTSLEDSSGNNRDAAVSGTLSFGLGGLPQGSDDAISFAGTGSASVSHDAGLEMAAFTISLWFRYNALPDEPSDAAPIISKDASGLNNGDFSAWVDGSGELTVQFQSTTSQFQITAAGLEALTNYHLAVVADSNGFVAYLNGQSLGSNTGWIGAWSANTQDIKLATAAWTALLSNVRLDEVAIYSRALSFSEILMLSQRTEAPIAANDSFVAPESATTVVDVVSNDTFVGAKSALTVAVVSQASNGTATVREDNDIDFAADAVDADTDDSFTYRITDANGQSNIATANVTIQNSASVGGGTLVYEWAPLASWIDGVALANRNADEVDTLSRWTNSSAATTGSSLPSAMYFGGPRTNYCFNRAPTDHPSIECRAQAGANGCINIGVRLFDLMAGDPRHVRVVMEVKTCKASDPTTYKANGLGTTTGSYPNWSVTHTPGTTHTAVKYFIGLFAGEQPGGGSNVNWWGNSSLAIDRMGHRSQSGSSSKDFGNYMYNFDRPSVSGAFDRAVVDVNITDSGVEGVWHRLEMEWKLAEPSSVPNDARRSTAHTEPTHSGNGFLRQYLTKDIDGELGTPGTRQLICETTGLMDFCKFDDVGTDDNMHTDANIAGFWIMHIFGGSPPAQAEGWAWIRKIQVYNHD